MKTRKICPTVLILVCISCLFGLASNLRAQPTDIIITTTVMPPYPPQISIWRSDPTRIQVRIQNTGAARRHLRLTGFLSNSTSGHLIETKDDYPVPAIDVAPGGLVVLTGRDLSLFSANAVRFIGDGSTVERTGILPEGDYQICLKAIDYDAPHTEHSIEWCTSFTIRYVDPPRLLQPTCESTIPATQPQSVIFSWIMSTPVTAPLDYDFILAEVPAGRNPNDAFLSRTTPEFFHRVFHNQTTFLYSTTEPTLIPGRTYVWRVQSADPQRLTYFVNNGISEVCSFTFGAGATNATCNTPLITAAFPKTGTRIPYRFVPVIIKYDPYCDNYHHFRSTFQLSSGSPENRSLDWSSGPLASQRVAVGDLTQEQAQYIVIGRHGDAEYPPGVDQSWSGNVALTLNGHEITNPVSGTFSVGMGPSQLQSPANDSNVNPGNVTLSWQTANAPGLDALKPAFDIRQASRVDGVTSFHLYVREKWVLEVSRSHDITAPVYTTNGSIGDGLDVLSSEPAAISDAVYKLVQTTHSFTDTGDYYWRVKWLSDPNNTSSAAYATSDVFHFHIGAASTTVNLSDCLVITPASPLDGGTWSAGLDPKFSVLIRPSINISAITGGHIQVWRRATADEASSVSISRTAVLDASFTGHNETSIRARAGQPGAYDLRFVNETGSATTWHALDSTRYLWRFTLQFDRTGIRQDGQSCTRDNVVSSDGTFKVQTGAESAESNSCHDDCSAPAITDHTAVTHTFASGTDITVGRFTLHLGTTTGTGSGLSGSGTIAISFLNNIHIAVDFTDLHVNAANQVFSGTVRAHWGGTSPLPNLGGVGSAIGLTQDQISSVSQAAGQPTRLLSQILTGASVTLPLGIDTIVGGQRITIGVIDLTFESDAAHLAAAVSIPMPQLGPDIGIGLGAREICFTPSGLGGDGRAKLYLPSDIGYRQDDPNTWGFVFKGTHMDSTHTITDEGTYVSWNCHGFEALRIAADVVFPRNWFVPVSSANVIDTTPSNKVTASFTALIERSVINSTHSSWGWMATATMGKFAPASAPDLIMEVNEIVIDQSDDQNADGMVFPDGYAGDHGVTWRGFYMKRLAVALPPCIRTFDSSRPVTIALQNMLIDRTGFSASIRGENIIMYPHGNFGEWGASIDTAGVDFVSSSLHSGYLIGRFQIPISDSALDYRALLSRPSPDSGFRFDFTITARDTINANLWVAKLLLNPTSQISLHIGAGSFVASADLSGSLTIAGNISGATGSVPGMSFRGITFEHFRVSSDDPHITTGSWHFASEQHSAAGFPVSISNIGLLVGDRDGNPGVGIQFTVTLNLQSGSNGIGGGTTISLWGVMANSPTGGQMFRFHDISINEITLSVDVGSAVHVTGTIDFYNGDHVYGNGFRGSVHASILTRVTVDATVQFGSVPYNGGRDTNRYWYVDAMAYLSPGIPFMTGVAFYGLGGGAWYHMTRGGADPTAPISAGGSGHSGYTFVPDPNSGFGFRAKVAIGTYPSDNVLNADIALEVQFLSAGGVGAVTLIGDGWLLAGISDRSNAPAHIHLGINYDFPTTTLDGRMSVSVSPTYAPIIQVLSGDSVIVFHADPATWYFRMGMPPPDQRVGVQLASVLRFDSYLMAGDNLPDPQVLPAQITSHLGQLPVVRNAAMEHGDGFAFGASMDLNTGRQQFLIFYGQLELLMGFDFGLLHLDPTTTCEGTGTHPGVNNWYATGDIYAYAMGEIGLHVDVMFASGDFTILRIEAAAAIMGGAPNPTWVAGAVSGDYNILGGLVSGHCHYQFKIGDECRPVPVPPESPLAAIGIISDVKPGDGEHNVDVFAHPTAAFNFAVDRDFELHDLDAHGNDEVRTFHIRIRNFTLENAATHESVAGSRALSTDATQSIFTPDEVLHGRTNYTVSVTAYGEEDVNGSWQQATRRDGTAIDQNVSNTFTTGADADHIPEENVAYSYPLNRQRYFLQDECRTGLVQLKQGQASLFTTSTNRFDVTISLKARFIPVNGGTSIDTTLTYNNHAVNFDIPQLQNNTIYALQLIRKLESRTQTRLTLGGGGYGGATMALVSLRMMYGGSTAQITERRMPGTTVGSGEKLLYLYYFRSSQFNTLANKLTAWTALPTQTWPPFGYLEGQTAMYSGAELLDVYDMDGMDYDLRGTTYHIAPLIRPNGNLRTSTWHTAFTNPSVYNAIDRLRNMHLWSGSVMFEHFVTNYNRGLSDGVLAQYSGQPRSVIADIEIMPPPSARTRTYVGSRNYGSSTSRFSSLYGSTTIPHVSIEYHHGSVVPFDFFTLRNRVGYILSVYDREFFSPADYNFLESVLAKSYEPMYHTNYSLGFIYSWPGCVEPDGIYFDRTIHKTFSY